MDHDSARPIDARGRKYREEKMMNRFAMAVVILSVATLTSGQDDDVVVPSKVTSQSWADTV